MYLKAYFETKENREQEIKEYTEKTDYLELGEVRYVRKDYLQKLAEKMIVKLIFEGKLKIGEGHDEYFERAINEYLDSKNNNESESI